MKQTTIINLSLAFSLATLLTGCLSDNSALTISGTGSASRVETPDENSGTVIRNEGPPTPVDQGLIQEVSWNPISFSRIEGGSLVLETGAAAFDGKIQLESTLVNPGETIELELPSSINHFFIDLNNGDETLSFKFVGDEVQEAGTDKTHPLNGNDKLQVTVTAYDKIAIFLNDTHIRTKHAMSVGSATTLSVRFYPDYIEGLDFSRVVFYQSESIFSSRDLSWYESPVVISPAPEPRPISDPIDLNGDIQLQSARILPSGEELELVFNRDIELSNAAGFRLTGGPSRIKSLRSGSGTNTLVFSLTNHVHPESRYYHVLHWTELSDARSDGLKLASFESVAVDNQVSNYSGEGTVYYVAAAGNNSNSGSFSSPLRQPSAAVSRASRGDLILLKRGDRFDHFTVSGKRMSASEPLIISSYGTGNLPKIQTSNHGIIVDNSDHVVIDSLEVIITGGSGKRGVSLRGNSDTPIVSNCVIDSPNSMNFYGIEIQRREDNNTKRLENPQILNNLVRNFQWNIRSSGWPYDGTHHVYGGLIENNISDGNYDHPNARDGISTQRGFFHNIVIRKNEVRGYVDDGMDFFAAHDVIIEYNRIHSPKGFGDKADGSGSGNALKLGGRTAADRINGVQSENIVARYNRVYDVTNEFSTGGNGIVTNGGRSGEIYGNLVINTKGAGIKVDGAPGDWLIYNNTVVDAKKGFDVYSNGGSPNKIQVFNNILHGNSSSSARTFGAGNIQGESNIFLPGISDGNYSGKGDLSRSSLSDVISTSTYRPGAQSPASNGGVDRENYLHDILGIAVSGNRNIGAFE